MNERDKLNRTARLSGLFYLLLAPFGFFGMMYVSSQLVVEGDPVTTLYNITGNESLFRLSMASLFIMNLDVIILGFFLFKLLKHIDRGISVVMVVLVFFGACISMISELNHFAVLVLSNSDVFSIEQTQFLIQLFLELREYGSFGIAGIFWGLWLLPLGYLVIKSNFIPNFLGILLLIAGVGYVIGSFIKFIAPDYSIPMIEYTSAGEIVFALWLIIKGIGSEKKKEFNDTIN